VNPSRRRRATQRPLVVPAPLEQRRPLSADALRAAFGAHKGHEHHGAVGYGCRTCRGYVLAIATARTRQAQP
jgi:hypothetical protein